jgi:hypothetical protein
MERVRAADWQAEIAIIHITTKAVVTIAVT